MRGMRVGLAGLVVLSVGAGLGPGAVAKEPVGTPEVFSVFRSDPADPRQANRVYAEIMAIPSTDTGYVPVTDPPDEDNKAACPPSRCHDYTVPVSDDVKVTSSVVRVLLPRRYKHRTRKRFPVVYLYNGARSPYIRWSVATELTEITRTMDAIFVMPEGGIGEDAGMFSDWVDGSWTWETFHTGVLPAWVDRRFRTTGVNGAVGASMGSLGAYNYAARHPGFIDGILSISGLSDTNAMRGNILPPEYGSLIGLSPPDLRRVWGNPVLDDATWDAHNPSFNAPALAGTKILIAAGTGSSSTTSETGDPLHTGYTEQLMWQTHRFFLKALTDAGVKYRARIRQGGVHNWPYFDTPLEWGLPRLVEHLDRR